MNLRFVMYRDVRNEWRWYLQSIGNGRKIADSGEGYRNRADCEYAIGLVKGSGPSAPTVLA